MARLLIKYGALDGDWSIEINPLAAAAENGHINVVELLTENGIYPYMKYCGGFALVKALHHGHVAIASLWISRGADIEFETGFRDEPASCSPLVVASRNGHESLVRLLISKGARIDHLDPKPLVDAAGEGHEAIAELLIREGASVNKAAGYATPLMVASLGGHEVMVKLLIDYGADVNQTFMYDTPTPLKIASDVGHEAVVRLLLEHGAQPEARETLQIPLW